MNDEQIILASAYLDGDVTAAERIRAEADGAVMAEVDRLRRVRDLVRDVDPPLTASRETAVAAALAEFVAATASTEPAGEPARPGALRYRPRPAMVRWVGIAAAVVGVAALGVVLATADRGDDGGDDAATFEAAATLEAADETVAGAFALEEDATMSAEADDDTDAGSGSDARSAATDAPETMAATAEEGDAAPADDHDTAVALEPPAIEDFSTPDELASFAAEMLARDADAPAPTSPAGWPCQDRIDGTIIAIGSYLGEDVVVVVDEAREVVRALDTEACDEVAEAAIPSSE